jgi:hypothetical protein
MLANPIVPTASAVAAKPDKVGWRSRGLSMHTFWLKPNSKSDSSLV